MEGLPLGFLCSTMVMAEVYSLPSLVPRLYLVASIYGPRELEFDGPMSLLERLGHSNHESLSVVTEPLRTLDVASCRDFGKFGNPKLDVSRFS